MKRRKQRGALSRGMFCCQRYFLPLAFCSAQDNDALCAGTGGGGRWTGHGRTQPTAAGTRGAGLLPCLVPQPTTSLKEVQGEILYSCSEDKTALKTSEKWVISEQVLLKRPVQLFLIAFKCCFLFAAINYFYTVFPLFSLLCLAVYVPSLSLKVRIAQCIENEFDSLSWQQGNSVKTQR